MKYLNVSLNWIFVSTKTDQANDEAFSVTGLVWPSSGSSQPPVPLLIPSLYRQKSDWWQGSVHYFNGYCELQIDKTYNKEQVTVEMRLDTPTNDLQVINQQTY